MLKQIIGSGERPKSAAPSFPIFTCLFWSALGLVFAWQLMHLKEPTSLAEFWTKVMMVAISVGSIFISIRQWAADMSFAFESMRQRLDDLEELVKRLAKSNE